MIFKEIAHCAPPPDFIVAPKKIIIFLYVELENLHAM
jgi:hypothetical protein